MYCLVQYGVVGYDELGGVGYGVFVSVGAYGSVDGVCWLPCKNDVLLVQYMYYGGAGYGTVGVVCGYARVFLLGVHYLWLGYVIKRGKDRVWVWIPD